MGSPEREDDVGDGGAFGHIIDESPRTALSDPLADEPVVLVPALPCSVATEIDAFFRQRDEGALRRLVQTILGFVSQWPTDGTWHVRPPDVRILFSVRKKLSRLA